MFLSLIIHSLTSAIVFNLRLKSLMAHLSENEGAMAAVPTPWTASV